LRAAACGSTPRECFDWQVKRHEGSKPKAAIRTRLPKHARKIGLGFELVEGFLARTLTPRLDRHVDLHVVPERHASTFDESIPAHTKIGPLIVVVASKPTGRSYNEFNETNHHFRLLRPRPC
jgi:hypothetical protein